MCLLLPAMRWCVRARASGLFGRKNEKRRIIMENRKNRQYERKAEQLGSCKCCEDVIREHTQFPVCFRCFNLLRRERRRRDKLGFVVQLVLAGSFLMLIFEALQSLLG
jgi:uncharacterized paraquat-inducible protein A